MKGLKIRWNLKPYYWLKLGKILVIFGKYWYSLAFIGFIDFK